MALIGHALSATVTLNTLVPISPAVGVHENVPLTLLPEPE